MARKGVIGAGYTPGNVVGDIVEERGRIAIGESFKDGPNVLRGDHDRCEFRIARYGAVAPIRKILGALR